MPTPRSLSSPPNAAEQDPNWSDTNLADLVPPLVEPLRKEREALPENVGRFRVKGLIARGGMGIVLRAYDPLLDRELALKVMRDPRANQDQQRRFIDEAQISSRLQHPGIIPLHELAYDSEGRPFFVMKLVAGRTLADLLAERCDTRQDLPRFLHIFEQICQTVAYAHSKGVLHRDLKPMNVMVGAFGEVQVMDWGLAKAMASPLQAELPALETVQDHAITKPGLESPEPDTDPATASATREGTVLGTLAYMAPEQARGEVSRFAPATDVFALGAILCEIITGRPPFLGSDWKATLPKVQQGDLSDTQHRLRACGVEAPLTELTLACLSPRMEDRPTDAGEVAELMRGYLASVQERLRSTELARAQALIRAEQEHRARRLTATVAGLALLLLVALVGGGWWITDQQAQRRITAENTLRQALADARVLQAQGQWTAARTTLRQTEHLLDNGDPTLVTTVRHLEAELLQGERDRNIELALEQIQLSKSAVRNESFDPSDALLGYQQAFANYGWQIETDPPPLLVAALERSQIRERLCAALDDFAYLKKLAKRPREESTRLWEITRAVDQNSWRNRLREELAAERINPQIMRELAEQSDFSQPLYTIHLLGFALDQPGDKKQLLTILRRAYLRQPNDFWLNYYLARTLETQNPPQLQEALRFHTATLALRPQNPGVLVNLGHIYDQLNRLAEAETAFRQAVALAPNYAMAHFNLGLIRERHEDYKGAIPHYQRALQIRPGMVRARVCLAQALAQLGRFDDAIASGRQAVELAPQDVIVLNDMSNLLEMAGLSEEALSYLLRAVKQDPNHVRTRMVLGNKYVSLWRPAEGLVHLQEAARLAPKDPNVQYNLGVVYEQLGRFAEALPHYSKSIELDPELAMAYHQRGLVLMRMNRLQQALPDLEKAYTLGRQPAYTGPSFAGSLSDCRRYLALEKQLPGVRSENDRLKNARECLEFARLCWTCRQEYVAALKFLETGQSMEPPLAKDLFAGYRYSAALAAIRAGMGQGDADKLSEGDRARCRQKALSWLREEARSFLGQLGSKPLRVRRMMWRWIASWRFIPEWAGVRDTEAMARLPTAEREAWQHFWQELDALLENAKP